MWSKLTVLLFALALASGASAQVTVGGGGGGGITQVSSLPGTCTATSSPVQLTSTPNNGPIYTCQNGVYALASQAGGALLPGSFGVLSNWQIESTGANFTVTSGSPTVTCTTCAFTAADTGKEMFFTNWTGSDGNYPTASAGPLTATTITFVNATTVTLSQNANINAGTTNGSVGVLAWGSNDDPASNSPWTALENAVSNGLNCQNAQLSGITNWEKPHFLSASCRGIAGGSTASKYPGITGFGVGAGATILLPPWFNATGCTGGISAFACTGQGEWANISFNTLGQAGNITKNVNFFETFNDGSYKDLAFWGGWAGTGSFFILQNGYHLFMDITIDGGPTPFRVSATFAHVAYNYFAGNGKSNTASVVLDAGASFGDYGGAFNIGASGAGVSLSANALYWGYNTILAQSSGLSSAAYSAPSAGSFLYLTGFQGINSGVTTSVAISSSAANYNYVTGSQIGGGATGKAWACGATSTCEAGPGNIYSGTVGTIGCAVNSVSPAACAGNPQGAFVVPISTTTYTVNTTAITANSVVLITPRTYTGNLPGAPTCVAPAVTSAPVVSAIVAGTSFTITIPTIASQTCWNYRVLNN